MGFVIQIILIIFFLILSACFSGSETALFSLSRARLLSYKESNDPRHKAISKLMTSYSYTLILLIFCNMLVNTALTLVTDKFFHSQLDLDPVYEQIITIVFAVVVLLIFGEVVPKTVSLLYSHKITNAVAIPILYLRKALFPIIWIMDKFFSAILNWIGRKKTRALNSEEYESYIEISAAAGAFSKSEQELLTSVFNLRDHIAEEVMTARVNLSPIWVTTPHHDVAKRTKRKKQEFYPVVTKDIDDSERILSTKEFFFIPPEERSEWLERSTFPATMIPANVSLTKVLNTLKSENVPAALVIDEYGRTIGMISARDIYTLLVGEVETVYDKAEYSLEQTGAESWIIKGMIPLFELEEAFEIKIPEEYESNGLNGLFCEILGRLPRLGDSIRIHNIKLVAEKISHRRVTEIAVYKDKIYSEDEEI